MKYVFWTGDICYVKESLGNVAVIIILADSFIRRLLERVRIASIENGSTEYLHQIKN